MGFDEFDRRIVFEAGLFILFTTILSTMIERYFHKIKSSHPLKPENPLHL